MIVLWWLACAFPEEEFRAQADQATCEWKFECFAEDYEDCLENAAKSEEAVDESCLYVEDEAQDCVNGLRQMQCPGDDDQAGFPSSCDAVWDCP